ncbi:MAG: hypothetical protein EA350_16645 [Gemmatimonadales bacterium]|nr:MAG: hypothetical protein EA350_16645 [Gemmatimonadales bacterium]
MNPSRTHLSPEYPVLFSISTSPPEDRGWGGTEGEGTAYLSLALLVGGIPSFLATLPVDGELVEPLRESLGAGDVQVAVAGIDVDPQDVANAEGDGDMAGELEGGGGEMAPWRASAGTPDPDAFHTPWPSGGASAGKGRFPAAYLSLICRDGRRLGVARIVSRDRRATPEEVARYVLKQITSGVQIPDLASA